MTKQHQKEILIADIISVIDEFITKDVLYYWKLSPNDVKSRLVESAKDGKITYNKASLILEEASTTKMCSTANKGMDEIRRNWRKNYIK